MSHGKLICSINYGSDSNMPNDVNWKVLDEKGRIRVYLMEVDCNLMNIDAENMNFFSLLEDFTKLDKLVKVCREFDTLEYETRYFIEGEQVGKNPRDK